MHVVIKEGILKKVTDKEWQTVTNELFEMDKDYREEWAFLEAKRELALNLNTARLEKGLNQRELGDLSGKKRQNISAIERGHVNPSIKLLAEIAVAMNKKLVISFEDIENETL